MIKHEARLTIVDIALKILENVIINIFFQVFTMFTELFQKLHAHSDLGNKNKVKQLSTILIEKKKQKTKQKNKTKQNKTAKQRKHMMRKLPF